MTKPVVLRVPEANTPKSLLMTQPDPDPVLDVPIDERVVNEPHKHIRIGVMTAKTRQILMATE